MSKSEQFLHVLLEWM